METNIYQVGILTQPKNSKNISQVLYGFYCFFREQKCNLQNSLSLDLANVTIPNIVLFITDYVNNYYY
jgi:hypothetical protein